MTEENKGTAIAKANDTKVANNEIADNPFITQLKQAEQLAEYIANSATYNQAFIEIIKDEEGRVIDKVVNKNDIIACILLGNEIGLQPMAAITLGKKLNHKSYFSVLKGKELGVDAISAIQQISVISTKNGELYHTGVHIINKVMIDNGVKFTVLADFKPIYKYKGLVDKKTYDVLNASMFEYTPNVTSTTDVAAATKAGKIVVSKQVVDKYTEIRFERPSKNIDYTQRLTLQECTDAGWYKGFHSEDLDAEGKPLWVAGNFNWNTMTRIMLRNRVFSLAGRIVVADRLSGTYTTDEVTDIPEVKLEEAEITTFEDVTDTKVEE